MLNAQVPFSAKVLMVHFAHTWHLNPSLDFLSVFFVLAMFDPLLSEFSSSAMISTPSSEFPEDSVSPNSNSSSDAYSDAMLSLSVLVSD